MKVILTGSTGYIGSEVLNQCINHPSISSIIVLTRRDPGDLADHSNVKVIVMEDFATYSEDVIEDLTAARAAIWCMGTFYGDEKVDIGYPLEFIKVMQTRTPGLTNFRFIYMGGALTEPPPEEGQLERSLWFYANGRRLRGRAEAKVMQSAQEYEFTAFIAKPGAVLPKDGAVIQKYLLGDSWCIRIDDLAATVVDLAVRGNNKTILQNREIIAHGRKVLGKSG